MPKTSRQLIFMFLLFMYCSTYIAENQELIRYDRLIFTYDGNYKLYVFEDDTYIKHVLNHSNYNLHESDERLSSPDLIKKGKLINGYFVKLKDNVINYLEKINDSDDTLNCRGHRGLSINLIYLGESKSIYFAKKCDNIEFDDVSKLFELVEMM